LPCPIGETGLLTLALAYFLSTYGSTILTIENLSKNFGGVAAIVRVSFSLGKGELLGSLVQTVLEDHAGQFAYWLRKAGFRKGSLPGRDITGKMPYKIAELGIARPSRW